MKIKTIISVFIPCLLLACSNTRTKYLPPQEFIQKSLKINEVNSAHSTAYIGKTSSRIYLEHWTGISLSKKGKTTVYWTDISKLSEEEINSILKFNKP